MLSTSVVFYFTGFIIFALLNTGTKTIDSVVPHEFLIYF